MSGTIRVLQVFAQMNRGGAESMVMNLYRNIDRSRVQFDFIVHTDERCAFDEEINKLGGKLFRIPLYNGKNHMDYKKSWINFFKNHPEYKIIHGHVRSTAAIYLRIAKKFGLTTIAHSHSTSSGKGFSGFVKNIYQYPIRYISDYLFACSNSAGIWLFGQKSCKKKNFHIINNAIDVNKFVYNETVRVERRNELKLGNKFVIGHVGRFHPAKNHVYLIDIFKEVHDRNKDSLLMLVGEGELRTLIEEKVSSLGLSDNVIFLGERADIPELLQVMDVFLFPSLYEGLPVTLIEAQASGLHCVVSKNITKEVDLTCFVDFISLKSSPSYWAECILEYKNGYKRQDTCNNICIGGYNIRENAKWLQDFYTKEID